MKTTLSMLAVLCGLMMFAAGSVNAQSRQGPENADEDGCFNTANRCVTAQSAFSGKGKYQEFKLKITNNCGGHIYMRYCMERTEGRDPHCGATVLGKGKSTWPSVTSTYNGTGRYSVIWTGVLIPDKAWVCSGKVVDWHDPPNFR